MSDCCDNNNKNKSNGTYDLAVIGAGSAGFSAAITAADQGAKVVVIGDGTIGGTCVNVGCVPSKALIRAAETLHIAKASERFDGITASAQVTDWAAVIEQKQALVDDLRKAKYSDILPNYETLQYIQGQARFNADGSLTVNEQTIKATKTIIATGTRPALPSINGINDVDYLTSTTALELETLPKSILIIGAGYIGAEITQIFARAGVKVTITGRRGLLPQAEPEISQALTQYFADEGITTLQNFTYDKIEQTTNGITLHIKDAQGKSQSISAEKVMIASGRTPNSDTMSLELAGIKIDEHQGIIVDNQMRTSRENVYAAGDVTGTDQFVYMAAYGAKIAANNAMKNTSTAYDNSVMPAVVFCDPQVASVGDTQAQAEAKGIEVKTSILTLDNVPRALAARDTRGLIKLIADAKTKKLIGAHILAPEGADSIQTAAIAIKTGMTYQELGAMIFPYLTTVEGLKLAAQTFNMDVKKLSCCAG